MQNPIKKHAEKIRFGMVGIANTVLDFAILFLLVNLGLDKIPANYISTSSAFVFSFFVNRSFTFKSTNSNVKKQFGMFLTVTLIGIWVIQPIVIVFASWCMGGLNLSDSLMLLVAKLIATLASLIWNYLFYSRVVFKKES